MSECVVCEQVITNPVCPDCLEQEVKTWLYEVKPELVAEAEDKTTDIAWKAGSSTCILCKDKMTLCPYCYLKHIESLVKYDSKLKDQFQTFFNFSFP